MQGAMRTAGGLEGQQWKPEMDETMDVILHGSSSAEKRARCLRLPMLFPGQLYQMQEIRLPEAPPGEFYLFRVD